MKRFLLSLLCLLTAVFSLSSCGDKGKKVEPVNADEITQVTALDSPYSSYLYVIEDKEAIAELCAIYNSLTYRGLNDGEEAPDDLLVNGKLYDLHFYDAENEPAVAFCYISPRGYLLLDDLDHPWLLTSPFDEDRLMKLLTEYHI